MKWIVFWVVVSINVAPCERVGPVVDEFGRKHNTNITTTEGCFSTESKNMSREFDTLEAAQAFVDRGKKDCGRVDDPSVYFTHGCSDFEIKELKPIGGKQ